MKEYVLLITLVESNVDPEAVRWMIDEFISDKGLGYTLEMEEA